MLFITYTTNVHKMSEVENVNKVVARIIVNLALQQYFSNL